MHPLVKAAKKAGVRDQRVLDAVAAVPRERFVPASQVRGITIDGPIPIPCGQTTSQPSLVARMVEALGLEGGERVLEVGTGLGYQAAILAALGARVWTIERHAELADQARENLRDLDDVEVVHGDGMAGLPEQAPFDAIILAAAAPEVSPALVDQLAVGGRLVQPVGSGGAEKVMVFERTEHGLSAGSLLTYARFVPIVTES
jgi:protein-L-isoaspartate(D-aspartate) O-methyltransferase